MRPTPRWLLVVPILCAVALVARLALVWAMRFSYPFDLEWMEGGMLLHADRIARDLPIYVEPGREFVPYIYPPGYPAVVAFLGSLTGGVGYAIARAVSLIGVIAAAGAIVRLVRDDGGDPSWGLCGAAAFLGCYEASGAFYDLVRPDGLEIGLLAWSVTLGLDRRRGMLEASGLLLAASFLAKHNTALVGLPMALCIGLRDGWRQGARFAAWSAIPALAATGVLQATSDGRFATYLIGVPSSHELRGERMFPGLPKEVFLVLPVATGVAFAYIADRFRQTASWRAWYALTVGIAVIVMVVLMRGHIGGFVNVLIPLHWLIAAAFAVGLQRWDRAWPRLLPLWALLATAQVGWMASEAWRWREPPPGGWLSDPLVPTMADREAGAAVIEALRGQPEPLWCPFAPWIAVQAGHPDPGPPLIAVWDIDRRRGPLHYGVDDIEAAISSGWYATIVDGSGKGLGYDVRDYYSGDPIDIPRGAFEPRTGWQAHPNAILHPKPARNRLP